MKLSDSLYTFNDTQARLMKIYSITRNHAGCYICNYKDPFYCGNCDHNEECKQISEAEKGEKCQTDELVRINQMSDMIDKGLISRDRIMAREALLKILEGGGESGQ